MPEFDPQVIIYILFFIVILQTVCMFLVIGNANLKLANRDKEVSDAYSSGVAMGMDMERKRKEREANR